ncbi:MAG TPA: pitrilysin family protein [Syntrophales bacterium]|nr:pitrilysin family protein [Syntrophales bacterium]HOL59866.1 pitrilysin family protein [Syntrophales bacterium]HPO36013.1 pitrilysin family protein [Syntrophales bacterium]
MYRKTVLPNGVRVVSERVDHVRSVSLGIWVRCGSRYETEAVSGISHFIEHMLFKGTERRSALEIASAIESVGGMMNAYTGKELTSFYVKVPDYSLEPALDVLADMFLYSRFDEGDIAREKAVVEQEINLLEDTPDDYIHDFCEARFWKGHRLALPVLGRREVVKNFTRDEIRDFFRSHYGGENIVIAASGNLDHDHLVKMCEGTFGTLGDSIEKGSGGALPVINHQVAVLEKDLEQVHMIVAVPAPSTTAPNRYHAVILNTLLGGSMSSRLFQEIREKRGLAYAVHSFWAPYLEAGMFGVYAGTGVKEAREVLGLILAELKRMAEVPVTDRELTNAKELVKGNYLLSMENTDTRMSRLARSEIYFGRHLSEEEILRGVDMVKAEDLQALAREIFSFDLMTVAAIGPLCEREFFLDVMRP